MLVKVKDIHANPYRNIDKYPIDREKVETLKQTIQKTGFWDNILLRKSPTNNHYELAYGHHRIVAVKELGIKEVDVPVKDISDADMLRIMADENFGWSAAPAVVLETVRAAKNFIDGFFSRYNTWEEIRSEEFIRTIGIESGQAFAKVKGAGAGRETILQFLGSNWTAWHIQNAMATLNGIESGDLSEKAFESLPSLEHANVLRQATSTYGLNKRQQEAVAKQIKEDGLGKRDVELAARGIAMQSKSGRAEIPDEEIARLVQDVEGLLEGVDSQARALANKIEKLNCQLKKLDVQQIKGLQAMFLKGAFADLLPAAKQLLKIVGVKGL
jgi:hypothetical protein